MNFQIVNTINPNAVHNTCVFSCFEAGDSITNLHVSLDRYKEQVKDLVGMMWKYVSSTYLCTRPFFKLTTNFRGHQLRVFLCGDYDFLCKMYGLSGASGIAHVVTPGHTVATHKAHQPTCRSTSLSVVPH